MKKLFALILAMMTVLACAAAIAEPTELVAACSPDYAPYEYLDGETVVGFDADLAAALSKLMDVSIRFESVDFDSILDGVAAGKYDMGLSCFTISDERKERVAFSTPYLEDTQCCIVKTDGVITDADTLAGMLIGAQNGSVGADEALLYTDEDKVSCYITAQEAVQKLLDGEVDAVITDKIVGQQLIKELGGSQLKMLDTIEFQQELIGIALPKASTDLKAKLDAAIDKLNEDGTLYELIEKWDLYDENLTDVAAE